MTNFFSRHLKNVDESYFTHFRKAFSFAVCLFVLSLKSLIHAIFPFFYEDATSSKINELNEVLQKRRVDKKEESTSYK